MHNPQSWGVASSGERGQYCDEHATAGYFPITEPIAEPMQVRQVAAVGPDRPETTVLVVDDHRLLAESLAVALDLQSDMQCVGTAGTVKDALEAIDRSHPDVVLMDLRLPGIDGIEGMRLVRARHPRCRILAFTGITNAQVLVDAAEAGAAGFVPKHIPLQHLTEAIRGCPAVAAPAPAVHEVLDTAAEPSASSAAPAPDVHLTEREQHVLVELAEGLDAKQIARRLGISVNTCRDHIRSVRHKFGVHTQLAAVVRAAQAGILPNLHGARTGDADAPSPEPPERSGAAGRPGRPS
jgi:DNA-binding NarL/FixJ family response regulator